MDLKQTEQRGGEALQLQCRCRAQAHHEHSSCTHTLLLAGYTHTHTQSALGCAALHCMCHVMSCHVYTATCPPGLVLARSDTWMLSRSTRCLIVPGTLLTSC